MRLCEYLEIGKIINTHGLKGEVKVLPLTDSVDRYYDLKWVYIDKLGKFEKYNITGVKISRGFVLVKFREIDSIEKAEKLKDLYLKVDRENAIKLPEDSFFICDLLGCQVFDEQNNSLGKIKDVLETGSNDVYVVEGEKYGEILIPALKSVVREVSLENGWIKVVLPEGLLDNEI
jgi:16S rRNA processing protein RimM